MTLISRSIAVHSGMMKSASTIENSCATDVSPSPGSSPMSPSENWTSLGPTQREYCVIGGGLIMCVSSIA